MASIKIAIYDIALHFIGGGQRYICQIAQILSQYHEVHLITDKIISKQFLESAYNIDLKKVQLICLHKVMQNLEENRKDYSKSDYSKHDHTQYDGKIGTLPKYYSLYEMIRDSFFNFLMQNSRDYHYRSTINCMNDVKIHF